MHARLTIEELHKHQPIAAWGPCALEIGGEDMPDAYRWIPVAPADLPLNVVAVYDSAQQQLMFLRRALRQQLGHWLQQRRSLPKCEFADFANGTA